MLLGGFVARGILEFCSLGIHARVAIDYSSCFLKTLNRLSKYLRKFHEYLLFFKLDVDTIFHFHGMVSIPYWKTLRFLILALKTYIGVGGHWDLNEMNEALPEIRFPSPFGIAFIFIIGHFISWKIGGIKNWIFTAKNL